MNMAFIRIDEYVVSYSTHGDRFPPRIWLYSEGRSIGQLLFARNGAKLPQDEMKQENRYWLWYHLEDFSNLLDLLRNEKPVYLVFGGSGPEYENGIRTFEEEAGEGET